MGKVLQMQSRDEATVVINSQCPFCGKRNPPVTVTRNEANNYNAGMHAQNAFKSLSPQEREYIMTGICEECWPSEEG